MIKRPATPRYPALHHPAKSWRPAVRRPETRQFVAIPASAERECANPGREQRIDFLDIEIIGQDQTRGQVQGLVAAKDRVRTPLRTAKAYGF
jgi:hypothetical protein